MAFSGQKAFTYQSNGHTWCGNMVWLEYDRLPSKRRLRAEGRQQKANYYATCDKEPNGAAFLTLDRSLVSQKLHSLAVAMARQLGASAFGEFELPGGRTWVVATDSDGKMLPGSDQTYSGGELAALKSTLAGITFTKTIAASEQKTTPADEDVEDWFRKLEPAPLILRPVSLSKLYGRLAAGAGLGVVVLTGVKFYERHEANVARIAAIELAARRAKPVMASSGPAELVEACMQAVPGSPYHNGWALAGWVCNEAGLNVTWLRAGGTLADAPVSTGLPANNGNIIEQHIPVQARPGRHEQPVEGDPVREFVGLLQRAGVAVTTSSGTTTVRGPRGPQSTHVFSVKFSWPTDPRAIPWDRYAWLSAVNLHQTVLTPALAAGPAGTEIVATFAVAASQGQTR